ncbi:Glycosyltransferase involved in cell wall bisynthesis [Methylobacterium sp. 190mf]|uniref:glycosyltransferase family 2 protein n=1 Tax=Methylobacterium sp. 190mf TaxID=1761798 RepID=UPI00089F5048|nr:glycosyltransferase family 2 protein [Methylobacterium sp. 190mf]SEF38991.1 Glycosyltransferase involved in cell wall bisynthesis [Methylobacterium sp. 190mf]
MKTISIIIINHNYGEFLAESIRSCLSQNRPPHEIIVVDDGSTDCSRDIIAGFSSLLRPVFHDQRGHVESVNSGFQISSGQICIFLDADDFLHSNCLEIVDENWEEGLSKLQYRLDTVDRQGVDQKMPFPSFSHKLTPDEVFRQSLLYGVYPWTVSSGNAYSREFLLELLPIDSVKVYRSPDGYLNKLAPLYGRVKSLDAILGSYRVHGQNAWAQDAKSVKVEPIIRWLNFDLVLQSHFMKAAENRQLPLGKRRDIRSLQQLEYRMLASRLAPDQSPHIGDKSSVLFFKGIVFLLDAPNVNYTGRFVWLAWIFTMAFMPSSVVRLVFQAARGQIGRWSIFDRIIRKSQKMRD